MSSPDTISQKQKQRAEVVTIGDSRAGRCPPDAIRHALAAKDLGRAAGLIELAWPEGSVSGHSNTGSPYAGSFKKTGTAASSV